MNTATEQLPLSLTENSGNTQPAEIKQLAQKKNRPGVNQIIAHLGVIMLTGSLVWQLKQSESPWLWPMLLIHGSGLVLLVCALQETIQRTAVAGRRLNPAVSPPPRAVGV
jgi:hypothetical protein